MARINLIPPTGSLCVKMLINTMTGKKFYSPKYVDPDGSKAVTALCSRE
jgi:hypothetical protein